jgi:3-hydroxyisobutyrate dehydrogenase
MAAIGFIGLGAMGRHMAASLQRAGHRLSVHDLNRDAAREHLAAGARWADSAAAAAEGAGSPLYFAAGPRGCRGNRRRIA